MKLDEKIFKSVFGRDYDKNDIEEEDMFATMALHYWLNVNGVMDRSRDYNYYVIIRKGVASVECMQDIKCLSADNNYDPAFSDVTKAVISATEVALELTAEEMGKRFDERDAVIEGAVYDYVKRMYRFVEKDADVVWKRKFKKEMPEGNFELAKTFVACFEYAHEAITNQTGIIVSPKANNDNQETGL